MTLKEIPDGGSEVHRLVECPFCGAELGRKCSVGAPAPPTHLADCEAFERVWRDDHADVRNDPGKTCPERRVEG